jgi:hypothetical protein
MKKNQGFAGLFIKEGQMQKIDQSAKGRLEAHMKLGRINKSQGYDIVHQPQSDGGHTVVISFKEKGMMGLRQMVKSLRGGSGHGIIDDLDSTTKTVEEFKHRGISTIQTSHEENDGLHTVTIKVSKTKDRQHFDGSYHDH